MVDHPGANHRVAQVVRSGEKPGAFGVVPVQIDQHHVGVGDVAEDLLAPRTVGLAGGRVLVEDRLPGVVGLNRVSDDEDG